MGEGDYVQLNAHTSVGAKIAVDKIVDGEGKLVEHQRVKMQHGEDGLARDVSHTDPLPVIDVGRVVEGFETLTGITGSTDISNIALSTEHRGEGKFSVSFDKDGTTQAYALIEKTITSIDLHEYAGQHDIEFNLKLPSIDDVALVYVTMGSSVSNNIYWQTPVADLAVGWNLIKKSLTEPEAQVGTGICYEEITWVAVYIGFNSAANTLAGIKVDNIEIHESNLHRLESILTELELKADLTDKQPITNTDEWYVEVAKGNVPGHSLVRKFARNSAIPSGAWAGILGNGVNTFNWLQAATAVRIKAGGNAADTAAGAGAQSVEVFGLDDTGALASEVIVTAGASASALTTTLFWRVFICRMPDGSAGTYGGNNAATIVIENGAGGTDLISILAGFGSSEYGAYSIPLGHTGYIAGGHITVNASKAADVRGFVRHNLTDVTTPFSPSIQKLYFGGLLGAVPFAGNILGDAIPALSDVWMEANGNGNATEVDIDFNVLLVQDGF